MVYCCYTLFKQEEKGVSDMMNDFFIGLTIGTAFGLALTIIFSRLAGSIRWVAGIFGYSVERKKIVELEKHVKSLEKRIAEKDKYIKKAVETFKKESGVKVQLPKNE